MELFKIIVWALIFTTRMRFPPGLSIATILKITIYWPEMSDGPLGCFGNFKRATAIH